MVEEDEGDMVSEEMFQCVLAQSRSPSLMNQLLLSGLRLRNQTFYDRVPLIISKNGKYLMNVNMNMIVSVIIVTIFV